MTPAAALARLRGGWRALRRWLRPPRRLRFTTSGALFLSAAFGVGLAAVNTGNNLLYLLLGAMLGFVAASGWVSEQMLRRLTVRRRLPPSATAGRPARFAYEVTNGKRRLSSWALTVGEVGRTAEGFLAAVPAGETRMARVEERFERRGVHALEGIVVQTTFPFGFFRKGRILEVPGALVVRPRADLRVRRPRRGGDRAGGSGGDALARAGARGEFRSLREYRAGDDPRDIHWRSSARLGTPVVREYEREEAESLWICLDLAHPPSDRVEAAIEVAASLAARAVARGERFALVLPGAEVPPGAGAGHLDRVLDTLARVEVSADAPHLLPPIERASCVLVTPGRSDPGWADVLRPEDAGEPDTPGEPEREGAS